MKSIGSWRGSSSKHAATTKAERSCTGPLEFVSDGINGFVCAPDAASLGRAITAIAADRTLAERMGRAGQSIARAITWDGVIEQLLG